MKKIILLVLASLLVFCLSVPAYAAGAASLTCATTTVYRGDTVSVTVYVSNVAGAKNGGVTISYGAGLTLEGGEWLMSGLATSNVNVGNKAGVFLLNNATNLQGNILRLDFKVKKDAAFGTQSVSVELTVNGGIVALDKPMNLTVACRHSFGNWVNWGATVHGRTCNICGGYEQVAHNYDNACDTACNTCGATRTTEHVFGEEWTADETGHWYGCVHCGEKSEFAEHTPGEEAGEYTDQICTICEFVIVPALGHVHTYEPEKYLTDEASHWQVCLGCGEESEHVEHGYDDACDEVCDACQYTRRVLHDITEQWTSDGLSHWKDCADCDKQVDLNAHLWDAGTVQVAPTLFAAGEMVQECGICHKTQTVEMPKLTILQGIPWWGWLAGGALVGAVITLSVTLIIISAKAKKNGKGKFAN